MSVASAGRGLPAGRPRLGRAGGHQLKIGDTSPRCMRGGIAATPFALCVLIIASNASIMDVKNGNNGCGEITAGSHTLDDYFIMNIE